MRTLIKNILLIIIIALNSFTVFAKDNLVTDLSESTVEISSTFSGADILLFGAYDGQKNDDIIVVVSGQKGNIKVDKKEKKFGIWMITESVKFSNLMKGEHLRLFLSFIILLVGLKLILDLVTIPLDIFSISVIQ